MNYILILSLIILCILDLKYKKIFNIIAYPIILLGIFININNFSLNGFSKIVLELFLAVVVWYISYALHLCKYGEFKLLLILFLLGNLYFSFLSIIISYLIIFIVKVFSIVKLSEIKKTSEKIQLYISMIFDHGISVHVIYEELSDVKVLPFSLILLCSTAITFVLK